VGRAVLKTAMCGGEGSLTALKCPMQTDDVSLLPPVRPTAKYLLEDEREILGQMPPPSPPPVFDVE